MGKSISKDHEEYDRGAIKCHGYIEKYSYKSGKSKRRYFILNKNTLSYAKSKDLPVRETQMSHSSTIDRSFKILYDDIAKQEIGIECLNELNETSLWRLIFPTRECTEKWLINSRII